MQVLISYQILTRIYLWLQGYQAYYVDFFVSSRLPSYQHKREKAITNLGHLLREESIEEYFIYIIVISGGRVYK